MLIIVQQKFCIYYATHSVQMNEYIFKDFFRTICTVFYIVYCSLYSTVYHPGIFAKNKMGRGKKQLIFRKVIFCSFAADGEHVIVEYGTMIID